MTFKKSNIYCREAFTDADNFGISFPLDLDVKVVLFPNKHNDNEICKDNDNYRDNFSMVMHITQVIIEIIICQN